MPGAAVERHSISAFAIGGWSDHTDCYANGIGIG